MVRHMCGLVDCLWLLYFIWIESINREIRWACRSIHLKVGSSCFTQKGFPGPRILSLPSCTCAMVERCTNEF